MADEVKKEISMKEKTDILLRNYYRANKLNLLVRTGWIDWNVHDVRVESVAEHCSDAVRFTLMLCSQFHDYDEIKHLNVYKVAAMVAVHDDPEAVTSDESYQSKMSKEDKNKNDYFGAKLLSQGFLDNMYYNLIRDYNEQITPESHFAKFIDKIQCILKAKWYVAAGKLTFEEACDKVFDNPKIANMVKNGAKDPFEVFFIYDQYRFANSKLFKAIMKYIREYEIPKELLECD